jgi:type II secretory pathway pseudopilin PulG
MSEKREHAPRNTVGAESGYAMAALLVAMAVMAVMMTVAIPVWKQAVQREKEEELVFRGQQYVHAITLFSRKYSNAFPPNVNVLVEQRFLRKKYKDPITNDDFQPIPVGQQGPPGISGPLGTTGQSGQRQGSAAGRGSAPQADTTRSGQRQGAEAGRESAPAPTPGRGPSTSSPSTASAPTTGPGGRGTPPSGGGAGLIGVVSKSKDKSIRLYNGRNHYNEWAFVYTAQMQAPGAAGAPGAGVPGQRGQRGQPGQPGQRGAPVFPGSTTPGRGQPPGGRGGPGGRNPFIGGVSPFEPQQPPPSRGRSGR